MCSRRHADDLISQGRVKVNNVLVDKPGMQIDPEVDVVFVDDHPLALSQRLQDSFLYIIQNKPPKVLTSADDPQGRKTVFDILPPEYTQHRLFHVGRLDFMSEGLLLLTTDGELANRMTHPRYHLPKRYLVFTTKKPETNALRIMEKGMLLSDGTQLAPTKASFRTSKTGRHIIDMTLFQGVNRQIRRMCKELDIPITRLMRIEQGPVKLGALEKGAVRPLTPREVQKLRDTLKLSSK